MLILKVMLAVAVGTYIAYEMNFKKKDGSSDSNNGKLEPVYERVPVSNK